MPCVLDGLRNLLLLMVESVIFFFNFFCQLVWKQGRWVSPTSGLLIYALCFCNPGLNFRNLVIHFIWWQRKVVFGRSWLIRAVINMLSEIFSLHCLRFEKKKAVWILLSSGSRKVEKYAASQGCYQSTCTLNSLCFFVFFPPISLCLNIGNWPNSELCRLFIVWITKTLLMLTYITWALHSNFQPDALSLTLGRQGLCDISNKAYVGMPNWTIKVMLMQSACKVSRA